MHSTNYTNAFIAVSPDCQAEARTVPPREGTVAARQHQLLAQAPYRLTSDALLFQVHALRKTIPESHRPDARAAFFAKPQACLRASPLVKSFGWGLHFDAEARVALVGRGSPDYTRLAADPALEQRAGMRSKRA